MKRIIFTLITMMMITLGTTKAQQTITVSASNEDISDHLDLEAVATLFGESKDLESFELKLNDPELLFSNLDLNNDGYVDYLRVIEIKEGNVYVITIQAVLGEDLYQDVATIDVEVKNKKTVYVQVVGNEYIYGPNYIFEPVYVHRPVIYTYFWHPRHVVWVSPWYWSYYPVYYHYRAPRHIHVYHAHIHQHYHRVRCDYNPHRKIHKAAEIHHRVHRDDWAKKHSQQSFSERNKGLANRYELETRRSAEPNTNRRSEINKPEMGNQDVRKTRPTDMQNSRPAGRDGNAPVVKSAPATSRGDNNKPSRRTLDQAPERASEKSKVAVPGSSAPERVYTKPEKRETVNPGNTRRPSDNGRNISTRTESPNASDNVRKQASQPVSKSKPVVTEEKREKPAVSPKSQEQKTVSKPSAPAKQRSESKAAPAKSTTVKQSSTSPAKRSSSTAPRSSSPSKASDKKATENSRR